MGGCTFSEIHVGGNARDTFNAAVDDARHDHGHGGYTGTLAEKGSYQEFPLPPLPDGVTVYQFVHAILDGPEWDEDTDQPGPFAFYANVDGSWTKVNLPDSLQTAMRRIHEVVDDKWGDAGMIDVSSTEEGKKALADGLSLQQKTGAFNVDNRTGKQTRIGPEPTLDGKKAWLIFGWASS